MVQDAETHVAIWRSSRFSSRWFCGAVADSLFWSALWRATFNLSYHNKETILFTIDPHYGNF